MYNLYIEASEVRDALHILKQIQGELYDQRRAIIGNSSAVSECFHEVEHIDKRIKAIDTILKYLKKY